MVTIGHIPPLSQYPGKSRKYTSSLSGSWSSVLGLANEEKGIFWVAPSTPSSYNKTTNYKKLHSSRVPHMHNFYMNLNNYLFSKAQNQESSHTKSLVCQCFIY